MGASTNVRGYGESQRLAGEVTNWTLAMTIELAKAEKRTWQSRALQKVSCWVKSFVRTLWPSFRLVRPRNDFASTVEFHCRLLI